MHKPDSGEPAVRLPLARRLLLVILRSFFALLYHQFAWTYDVVAWTVSAGNWQHWVEATASHLAGSRVLELGFGPGHLLAALYRLQRSVFGLDESRQMARLAQKRLKKLGASPNLVRGQAQNLPFPAESFDQVVLTFPSEYIFNRSTLPEVERVLVDGGTALILPLAWITGRKPWERLAAWVNRVTGQAPEWDPRALDLLKGTGLEASSEMIEFESSKMMLIKLEKIRLPKNSSA